MLVSYSSYFLDITNRTFSSSGSQRFVDKNRVVCPTTESERLCHWLPCHWPISYVDIELGQLDFGHIVMTLVTAGHLVSWLPPPYRDFLTLVTCLPRQ